MHNTDKFYNSKYFTIIIITNNKERQHGKHGKP
jgi:hypothetical protein